MHLHFERTVNAKSDCSILSLTWMGKVPDELPEDEGWKLNRTNYYQEGWLATGNVRGIVGVTFTTSHCKKNVDFPLRTNYNLRGHRSEVILVKWNEPYQKLASCDSSGIIFVWIKYEGRWSIELINDRNTPVTHFSWSHDGRMALICYQDGFVLVGSVAGQRYWSSMLNLESTITCGIWTPDDQQVYFGTTSGQIIVMDVHGAMVSQVQLSSEVGISSMAWSCEKFKMEEGEDSDPGVTNAAERKFVLAVSLQNGYIFLLKTFDDVSPIQINTYLQGPLCMEWSNSRELLAVAGTVPQDTRTFPVGIEYNNILKFYNERGVLLYSTNIPFVQAPVSALTWGHNDKRIFLATGTQIHIAWVSRRIASLQLMCRLRIHNSLQSESQLEHLPLPPRIRSLIGNLFAQTIRCCVPEASALREFVSRPPVGSVRLHCTMIRHDDDSNLSSGTCYTLYLEYLGGLVPLLKGKRTSKIRPEFVIFDPQVEELCGSMQWSPDSGKSSASSQSTSGGGAHSDSTDSDREEGCSGSPRMQRRKKRRNKNGNRVTQPERQVGQSSGDCDAEDLAYIDTLPEHVRLVEVTSNIWGTKFKIHGLASSVPANLGQVTYKTSLLHLQPRQMTLVMTELRDDFPPGPDPNFNPNVFSEDEEEAIALEERKRLHPGTSDHAPPIAPMSPVGNRLSRPKSQISNHFLNPDALPLASSAAVIPTMARAESYEDEFPYVELTDVVGFTNSDSLRPHCTSTAGSAVQTTTTIRSSTTSPSSTTIIGQTYSRNPTSNGQSRHAVSPLCCEGAVPALQSPKNAVAPSDIIFDRPPIQTLVSYASSDYSSTISNVQQVKSSIIAEHSASSNRNGVSLNLNLNIDNTKLPVSMKKVDVTIENTKFISSNDSRDVNSKNHSNSKDSSASVVDNCNSQQLSGKRKEKCTKANASSVGMSGSKEIRYIDDEQHADTTTTQGPSATTLAGTLTSVCITDSMVRSCSVGYLDLVDAQLVPCDIALHMLRKDAPKRLVLVNRKNKQKKNKKHHANQDKDMMKSGMFQSPKLKNCGKSKSLDSSDLFPMPDIQTIHHLPNHTEEMAENQANNNEINASLVNTTTNKNSEPVVVAPNNKKDSSKLQFFSSAKSPISKRKKTEAENSSSSNNANKSGSNKTRGRSKQTNSPNSVPNKSTIESNPTGSPTRNSTSLHTQALNTLENLLTRLRDLDDNKSSPPASPRLPRSSPASPAPTKKGKRPQSASPIRKHLLASPLLGRRSRKNKLTESSDDEVPASSDEIVNSKNYKDLETFQKAQLRQKLKRGKIEPNGSCVNPPAPQRREFVMHNKAPMWNENSQVYQLDFGGRVTQESAKNFQIEFRGKQVMQFGRIDGNAYTLDFQYPFSALQAFAVALANVTQRLK